MLKYTNVRFDLLTDIDMVMFVERGIRSGLSQCSNRYARVNNQYESSYDSSQPSSYLMYYDVNNLYGWTMCEPLPYAEFRSRMSRCVRHGLRVTKIYRALRFAQSPWLRAYIELNTERRTRASNEFEKNLYKLMNNAVFGKIMENVRNYVDVRLVTRWDGRYGAEALIAKPNFYSRSVFDENLMAIELANSRFNLTNQSTSYSLIYFLECRNIYENMKRDIARFDTSDYSDDNAYDIPCANKKVLNLMKDENNGAIMTEFIGLRAKIYALRVLGKSDTKRIKGVRRKTVAKTITFEDFARCLNESLQQSRRQACIRSMLHEI
ncbi:uncharacterized protein LOC105434028 [Pogonomyrmex barbatus]|uniref:Uncharacterized protein LOC105434028 n=1 Tax=Pogonomyrmex barbatus TaxID=144034 RepID=A0A6I9XP72_9HYME|nr:uncharacterized protein LOC105434028 [Pogonomyrmex barbatus]